MSSGDPPDKPLGLSIEDVAMVGDDLQADIGGSQALGMRGFMVRTDKSRPEEIPGSPIQPDRVIDSVAALPELLLG